MPHPYLERIQKACERLAATTKHPPVELLEAAPDLLEAAKAVAADEAKGWIKPATVDQLIAAIAKAEGRDS